MVNLIRLYILKSFQLSCNETLHLLVHIQREYDNIIFTSIHIFVHLSSLDDISMTISASSKIELILHIKNGSYLRTIFMLSTSN